MVDAMLPRMCRACGAPVEGAGDGRPGHRANAVYCPRHRYVLPSAKRWREALSEGAETLYRLRRARALGAPHSCEDDEGVTLWNSKWRVEQLIRQLAAQCAERRMRWRHAEIWVALLEGTPKARAAVTYGVSRPTVHATPKRVDDVLWRAAERAGCARTVLRDLLIAAVLTRRSHEERRAPGSGAWKPGGALDAHHTRFSRAARHGSLRSVDVVGWFKPVVDSGLPDLMTTEDLLVFSGIPDDAFAVRRYLGSLVSRGVDRLPASWYGGLTVYFWAARARGSRYPRNTPEEYGAFLLSSFVSALKEHLSQRTHKAEAWTEVDTGIAYCRFCGAPAYSAAKIRNRSRHVQPDGGSERCLQHLHIRRPPAWARRVDDLREALREAVAYRHRPGANSPVGDWHYRQVAYALVTQGVRGRDYAIGLLREEARRGGAKPPSMAQIARALGVSRAAIAKQYGGGSTRAEAAFETVRSAIDRAVKYKPMRYSPHRPIEARGQLEEAVQSVLVPSELRQILLEVGGSAPRLGTQEVHQPGSCTYQQLAQPTEDKYKTLLQTRIDL